MASRYAAMSEDCRMAMSIATDSHTFRVQKLSITTSPSTAQAARSLSAFAVRDEAKEVWPNARRQARKNRRCIRWNTLRIFSGRARRRWWQIVRRSRKVNVAQAPRERPAWKSLTMSEMVFIILRRKVPWRERDKQDVRDRRDSRR